MSSIDEWSDAEMVDNLDYTLFPNFHPWGAFNRIVYRFRPNGDDHRSSIMEVLFLAPFKGERPPPAPIHHLGVDDPWTDAAELGVLGKVFEQDTFNMPRVQLGPGEHVEARRHARQLPGEQGAVAAREARPFWLRRLTCTAACIPSARPSTRSTRPAPC